MGGIVAQYLGIIVGGGLLAILGIYILQLRRVVEPNEVHIVQNRKGSTSYGLIQKAGGGQAEEGAVQPVTESLNGNSYYEWPSWLPIIGCQVIVLPLSVFSLPLNAYDAYDIGKVPFVVDVVAFFRIDNPAVAAKRLRSIHELEIQLLDILRGAVRVILAQHEVEDIMKDRSVYGKMFTDITKDQLKAWGVVNVKNIELMDIRDGSHKGEDAPNKVIHNIMAKKASLIDRESREVVADNGRAAMVAEIDAQRDVDVQAQQAAEQVGLRTAKKDQEVGIANEHANQAVQSEAKETRTREMAVKRVEVVRDAEIQKDAQVVAASQDKETIIIRANGDKQQKITIAEGILVEQQKHGEGVLAVGTAEAEAKRLDEMAVVSPQIKLAEEIGENEGYQTYLVSIRGVEKDEAIGTEAAKALQAADIKVISNTGNVQSGVNKVMDLFSSKGGTEIGAFVEALAQTEQGAALLERMNGGPGGGNSAAA